MEKVGVGRLLLISSMAGKEGNPGMVGYLVEYAQFASPIAPQMTEVPGNNVVFRRDLLGDNAELRQHGFSKTVTLWRLARQSGHTIHISPEMRVSYFREGVRSTYWRRRYLHGRRFAAERCRQPDQPSRWFCAPFTVLLPMIRCWRILRSVAHVRHLRMAYHHHLWTIIGAETAWSLGECIGYITSTAARDQNLD